MNFKKLFDSYFKYEHQNNYKFTIPNEQSTQKQPNSNKSTEEITYIFPSLKVNLEYMKTRYNTLINSDIIIRQFTLNARGKQYDAFISYIDGMVDSKIMDDFILKPLMMRNKNNLFDSSQNKVISEAVTNNITIRKVKKFDLSNYIMGCLMPQNSLNEIKDFDKVCSRYEFSEIVYFLLKH